LKMPKNRADHNVVDVLDVGLVVDVTHVSVVFQDVVLDVDVIL